MTESRVQLVAILVFVLAFLLAGYYVATQLSAGLGALVSVPR